PTLYSLYFFLFMIHLPPTSTLFPHDALPISAASAALPAVLARQLDRPHVGGALLDHRGADPALAPGAAALPVPRALAHLPLVPRSEEHTSELQSQSNLVCRLLLEKNKYNHL